MNKLTKSTSVIVMLLLAVLTTVVGANAVDSNFNVELKDVIINSDSLNANQVYSTELQQGDTLPVTIKILQNSNTTATDVHVKVIISSDKDSVDETSDSFDLRPNTYKYLKFDLKLTQRMTEGNAQLRVLIYNGNSGSSAPTIYPLNIVPRDNLVAIRDLVLSPSDKVIAGRSLLATARLKNYGQSDEEEVKVIVEIPSLGEGVRAIDYIDTIDKDDTESTEDMLLRIPANAKSGTYDVEVTAYFNDGDDKATAVYQINVVGDEQAAQAVTGVSSSGSVTGKTTISVGVQEQTVARGENGVIYPLTLTNGANVAKTFTLSLSGVDWATTKITPSNVVVLNAGESRQVYVYIAASEATQVGEHVFSVDVKSGNDVVQQIPLKASVLESAKSDALTSVKGALIAGVIVLVVLIVILGIVILYQNKFKGKGNKEDEQVAQTYY